MAKRLSFHVSKFELWILDRQWIVCAVLPHRSYNGYLLDMCSCYSIKHLGADWWKALSNARNWLLWMQLPMLWGTWKGWTCLSWRSWCMKYWLWNHSNRGGCLYLSGYLGKRQGSSNSQFLSWVPAPVHTHRGSASKRSTGKTCLTLTNYSVTKQWSFKVNCLFKIKDFLFFPGSKPVFFKQPN